MDLSDLRKSISNMTDSELMDMMQEIRSERRAPAVKKAVKTEAKKERVAKDESNAILSFIEGLTPDMKAALIKKMGG